MDKLKSSLILTYADVVKQSLVQFVQQAAKSNKNTTCLQYMNEDCLLEIFAAKSLDLIDLTSISETCKRFHLITQRVAPKEMRICKINRKYTVENMERRLVDRDLQRILKNFGSSLSAISIIDHYCCKENFLSDLVAQHCVGNLESLKVDGCKISGVQIDKWKPILKRLQMLDIEISSIDSDPTLFADCGSLVELRVSRVDNCGTILENIFPKLERFTYASWITSTSGRTSHEQRQSMETLTAFIAHHSTLKTLDLSLQWVDGCVTNLLQAINGCTELEQLSIDIPFQGSFPSLQSLQTIKSLRNVKLREVCCTDLDFISPLTQLRELHFHKCVLPADSNQFASLTHLTKLKLETIILDEQNHMLYVVNVIRRLTNLKELEIVEYPHKTDLDEKTFTEIVRIVRGRSHLLTIKCRFNFDFTPKNCDERIKVTLLHSDDD